MPRDEWLTLDEAAAYLKVKRATLYRWMDAGLLPWYDMPMGRGRRFKVSELDALLRRRQDQEEGGAPSGPSETS